MSTRPRIRSLKPEMGQDEKFGRLSRDGRLLFVGLITLADDEGRFRALPSVILGHWYPYDPDAPRKLSGWMAELEREDMVVLYEVDHVPYGWLPGWHHQKINRPTPSLLPEPSRNGHGSLTDESLNDHGVLTESSSLARGRAPADRIGSDLTPPSIPPLRGGRERSKNARREWVSSVAAQFPNIASAEGLVWRAIAGGATTIDDVRTFVQGQAA